MITRIYDWVKLSIYSTRTLFRKYLVAMKYRRLCIFFILSESPLLKLKNLSAEKNSQTTDSGTLSNITIVKIKGWKSTKPMFRVAWRSG